jgi:16S rRNA G966 N2-methylase RsmD
VGSVDLIYLDPPFNSKNASRQRKGPAPEDSQGNLLEEARRPFGAGSGLINS